MKLWMVALGVLALGVTMVPGSLSAQQAELAPVPTLRGPTQVGEEIQQSFASAGLSAEALATRRGEEESVLVWRQEISMPGASYVAPHFDRFDLPAGAQLVVRAPDGSRSWSYTGFGKTAVPLAEGFWGIHIPGETAILEIYSRVPVAGGAVAIDRYAHGIPELWRRTWEIEERAICGADDSDWAKCYQSSEPTIYDTSRAVARLLINGSSACTGWLIGDDGHLMTNEHCIGSSSAALNTDYEFMAEGATCGTNCASFGACPGTVAATSGTLIQLDAALDYALVKLPASLATTYGFLQLRDTGAVLNERIYIPGHPAAWGKNFAVSSSHSSNPSGFCEVDSLNASPCSGGPGDVGYYCDTQGGSSGSAVIAYSDHCVVALHHCANCQNRGVPVPAIISDLGSNLPPNATCGSSPPPPPPGGVIDWNATVTTSYSNQDVSASFSVLDAGATFFEQNNTWRRTVGTYNITANTVLEFDYQSTSQGEIQGIGFDENDTLTDAVRIFQLYGTQNWASANHDFDNYSTSGTYKTYQIPVGQYYTGSAMYLVLVNDNDAGSGNTSYFRNVKIFESTPPPPGGCAVDDDFEGGASGWTTGGTCSTGTFILGNPTLVTDSGVTTQVSGSHSGSNSLFTASNSSAGVNDVDGGECVLTSPSYSVTNASDLSVWYFHGQRDAGDDPSGDYFVLERSINGGAWSAVVSIGDVTSNAAWTQATSSGIPAGSTVQLRVRVSDGSGPGDLVEGGIDDVQICDQ